jgi:two-component system chemotaxis sensor kinase CheA
MIDKYKEAFQEEAREILVELESALLELNENPGVSESVARAFRALHTIKGSGAMFGFDDIAAFTHHIENAFDEVRNGRRATSPELIGLTLKAADQIKAMLDESAGRGQADPAIAAGLLAKLSALTGAKPVPKDEPSVPARKPDSDARSNKEPALLPNAAVRDWRIQFRPKADLLRNGANPLLLFRELQDMGRLEITANMAEVPALPELDAERCYIAWDMGLSTAAPVEAIRDVFVFVEDCCELTIEAASQPERPVEETVRESMAAVPPAVAGAGVDDRKLKRQAAGSPAESSASDGQKQERRALERRGEQAVQASSIRVAAAKVDQLIDLVGQLVTVQARLVEMAARREDRDMQAVAEEIESLTAELRETSMSMRTLPLRSTFERFKRLVYDLGRTLHKEVELTFEGADTELDKTVIDQLNDPLMHLIRNSMDHGIEAPEARRAAGKPSTAAVHLAARHAGAQVLISVSDDGKGIDGEAVRARAIERGLIAPEARLSESEIFSLILAPGFSTAKVVSDVSGRGVGMDVVKRNVEALRGSIEIASQPGLGSTVTLRLPLTLAIIDGLLVRVDRSYFVLPLATILECIELTQADIEQSNGKHIANVRGEIIPYIRLREHFRMCQERPEREQVMITETEDGRYGFAVDQVLGDHQTVIKNLGRFYRHVDLVSGATILGDGTVALILDPQRLVRDVARNASQNRRPMGARERGGGAPRVRSRSAGLAAAPPGGAEREACR